MMPTISTTSSSILDNNNIAINHWNEWKNSAVSDEIINCNVTTILDSREIDKILNRNTSRRRQHSDNLVPAWCVTGVDPLTDERTLQGVEVKPDTSPTGQDGRIQKYLKPNESEAAPLFLYTGIQGYWKSIIDDILIPLIITEGAKKAGAGLSIGLATTSIPGVYTCRKKGRLHQNLNLFAALGRTFYLCFDNDILKKPEVQDALFKLAKELAAKGSKIMVIMLPEGEAKGMDDFIALHGAEAFHQLVTDALTFEEWKEEIDLLAEQSPYKRKKSKLSRNFDLINQSWGDYLRYNTLKKTVELKGRELLADKVRLVAARELDVDITATDVHTIVHTIAESNSYSPVVDYLNEVESKFPEIDPTFLDGLAQEYFGTSDPIHSTYFKKFLVAAVARARKPGEKVDHVFMLASQKQGLYKSTFFRILFGDDWFSDQLGGDISDKDEKMKMHLFWCLEWSEFESVYKRKDVATLKNFITSVEDTFRCPYDRQPLSYKRPCVFVGTTNEQEILHDPTGDRRFWIITVNKKIPIFQVIKDKDKIWAAANALHKSGFSWQLTDIEEEQREILNRDYHSVDPWLEVIEEFLTPGQKFVSTQSLYKVLDINPSDRDTYDARRISNVMRRLGWTQGRQKIDNRWKRGWVCTNNEFEFFASETDFTGSTGSTSETLATQASLFDPVKKPLLDLTGSTGSTLTHVSEDTILKSDPGDPVRSSKFFLLDQPEDAQSKGDPVDPVKPASEAKNQKFIESDRPLPAPREVIVEGRFGKSKCIITPLKVIKKRGVDCVFNWTFADGRTGEAKKVRITAGPPEADELAKRIINEWEQEQVKLQQAAEARELQQMLEDESRRYSVRQLGEDNYEWVKDCSLVEVPSYPVNTYFVFQTPDHKIIRVGDRSEFIQEGENEL